MEILRTLGYGGFATPGGTGCVTGRYGNAAALEDKERAAVDVFIVVVWNGDDVTLPGRECRRPGGPGQQGGDGRCWLAFWRRWRQLTTYLLSGAQRLLFIGPIRPVVLDKEDLE
jgi:hypothetical protein